MNIKEAFRLKSGAEDERGSFDDIERVLEGEEGYDAGEVVPLRTEAGGSCCQGSQGHDPVNRPWHYTSGTVECIDAIQVATASLGGFEAYLVGNCLKYLWRHKAKNGLQDLQKCRWYLDKLISLIEGSHGSTSSSNGK